MLMLLKSPQRQKDCTCTPPPTTKKVGASIVPKGSLGTRPTSATLGKKPLLEALKPSAMFPAPSIAILPIQ